MFTSNVGIDTRNSIIINNQSTQTIKERKVFKLNNLIVRQINGVELVLPHEKIGKIRLIVQPKPSCIQKTWSFHQIKQKEKG